MRLLFISPHLDDAILGCGAFIARAVEAGHEVLVVTCFTSPGNPADPEPGQAYQQRIVDDCCALSILGGSYRHLGLVDAPFRHKQYHNFSTLLFHHRLPDFEFDTLIQLRSLLRTLVASYRPDQLFFPMGVGGHIDHHLVWEASKPFFNGDWNINFYEEQPYAYIPGWTFVRWRQLGGQPTPGQTLTPLSTMPLSGTPFPFVPNYITSQSDWKDSTERYNAEFSIRPVNASQWTINGRIFDRIEWESQESHFRLKSQAILEYSSEWPALFGPDRDKLPDTLKQPSARERGWMLKTRP